MSLPDVTRNTMVLLCKYYKSLDSRARSDLKLLPNGGAPAAVIVRSFARNVAVDIY